MTIISDSIAKNVSGIDGCVVQPFRGDRISRLTNRIQSKEAKLRPYDYVIVHVGTNDIEDGASFNSMISSYGNLIGVIRKVHPAVKIVISAIIPRPKDHKNTDKRIRDVNSHLNKVMSKDMNFKFVCTYKPFNYRGQPNVALHAKNDGGLHLNTEGSRRLSHFFLQVISFL